MNREFSNFNQLDSIGQPWCRVVSRPLQAELPSSLPRPRATSESFAENGPWATPDQQFAAITEFIDTTTRLSALQLQGLALLERSVETRAHHELETQIEETVNANELLIVEAVSQLARHGKTLKIGHPQTGQSVPVIGMRYSNEKLGYEVAIPSPAPEPPTFMALFTSEQLHL